MSPTRMTTGFLTFGDLPLFCLKFEIEHPLEYFDGTWQKCRAGPDNVSCTRMTTLPFLLLELSPFILFEI